MTALDIWLSLPNLFCFFNIVLATLSCLYFQVNFSIHFQLPKTFSCEFFHGSIKSIWKLTSWHVDAFNSQIQLIWAFFNFFDTVLFLVQWLAHLLCFSQIRNILDLIHFIILKLLFPFFWYIEIKLILLSWCPYI